MRRLFFRRNGYRRVGWLGGWIGAILLLTACRDETLFRRLPAAQTGIDFANTITESDSLNAVRYDYLYIGAGVGLGDFDRDGRQDVFFAGNQVSSRLYLNRTEPGEKIRFEDMTDAAGVRTQSWCTGVSVVDLNGDDWPDVYVCVAGPDETSRANLLFINQGKDAQGQIHFREMAHAYGLADTGYSLQAAFFDYDHDGDLDCYLLTNAIEASLRNAVRPKRTDGEAPSTDRLYENLGSGEPGVRSENGFRNSHSSLLAPRFQNVSRKAGILTEGYGLGLCVSDLNGDGWEDVYCANDFHSNDLAWINNGDGTFTNRAAEYFKHQTHNGMGVDIADVNNDARPDVLVLDMLPPGSERQKMMLPGYNYDRFRLDLRAGYEPQFMRNTLQVNLGARSEKNQHSDSWLLAPGSRAADRSLPAPHFAEVSQLAGIASTDWSWAPLLADFDNDGRRDLYVTNGYRRDLTNLDFTAYLADLGAAGLFGQRPAADHRAYDRLRELPDVKLPNVAFRNVTTETMPQFEDVSETWGIAEPSFSNGAAYGDLDNDGDLDLVVNNLDEAAFVYENTLDQSENRPHYLRLRFDRPAAARGPQVFAYAKNGLHWAEANPVRGYLSCHEPAVHLGLGTEAVLDSLRIVWNDGTSQVLRAVRADQVLTIGYRPTARYRPEPEEWPTGFEELTPAESGLAARHVENEFNDFSRTPLLPHQYSKAGPPVAVGEVDGNGLDDVYLGADFGTPGTLWRQTQRGRFDSTAIPKAPDQEDADALFFDADQDGDLDLYVVSGGSHLENSATAYQDRLYRNDRGTFRLDSAALPRTTVPGSRVRACDYDHDGDLDLVRCGRLQPGRYPLPVKTVLLRNEIRRFTEHSLGDVGLVTDATWADSDGDGWEDLVLVGEWMAPTIFKNQNGTVSPQSAIRIPQSEGWWNCVAAADFDRDGDVDLMAGNLGLNSKFHASEREPVEVFAHDYDQNGRLDPLLTQYLQGRKVLVAQRDLLATQMPGVKKRFPDYQTYARATFEEAFSKDERRAAYHGQVTELRSMYFENRNGQWVPHPLPLDAQVSPVMDILVRDFRGDWYLDALLIGNFYAAETIGGWYDASAGTMLMGDSQGRFQAWLHSGGIRADRDARRVVLLNGTDVLVTNNNGPVQVWRRKK
jgi:hypothetical protein